MILHPPPRRDRGTATADPSGAFAWFGPQDVRPLSGLCSLVAELGVAPQQLAEAADVELATVLDDAAPPRLSATGRLFAAAATLTGRDEIGLLLGQRVDTLAGLGPLGLLMRQAPDLLTALQDLVTHQGRSANGAFLYLLRPQADAFLGCAMPGPSVEGTPQLLDAGIVAGVNLLRTLAGVVPAEVQLARALPPDAAAYRRVLGAPVRFDAPFSALVLDAQALARPIPDADPVRRRRLVEEIAAWRTVRPACIVAEVTRLLLPRMTLAETTLDATAAILGIHPRTLERRLQDSGISFRSLHARLQHDIACQLLRDTRMSVAAISEALGYCDPSAFGNWFRRVAGEAPARWRALRRRTATPPAVGKSQSVATQALLACPRNDRSAAKPAAAWGGGACDR